MTITHNDNVTQPSNVEYKADTGTEPRRNKAWIPILIVFLGILLLLYPVFSTNYNNFKQREFASKYSTTVAQIDNSDKQAELERARAYNKKLPGVPILDPWIDDVANPASKAYAEYQSQLDLAGDVMARVRVPAADIDLPVRHDTTDDVIATGAGHLYGTALPVGGEGSHAVLTSHTGMSNATLFDNLTDVKEGDIMYIEVLGETLAYEVDQIKVVLPDEIKDLASEPGHDYLTLFTCSPYAVNTHRLLVRGERIPFDSEVAAIVEEETSSIIIQPWMWWLLGGALLGFLLLVAMARREKRRRKARRAESAVISDKHSDDSPGGDLPRQEGATVDGHGEPPAEPSPKHLRRT